ncbi:MULTISPECIES: hypothetical protein [Pseudomonas]|uniref:Uncharacterized protein n=1 Tax=Pseudomonas aeruginosa TaxID=287 RepID=A0A844NPA8_PSEAI|nr:MULTISPECIES: hypothetical protein [Pseudomonas]EKJ7120785.1 hypothetical protein [Pseudomonas aeruginosa]EKQ7203873.1 hypothetical protein [Pseudomonas aeruginosa]EKT9083975.1 hypothetical protein [Pseudomonas aeruginosa]EKU6312252.1 hypothetical protein [Pseudomonas aeruginosa]EKX2116050.1 hypothetical protein [Pseudomonas aeruginosa]
MAAESERRIGGRQWESNSFFAVVVGGLFLVNTSEIGPFSGAIQGIGGKSQQVISTLFRRLSLLSA